MWITIKKYIFLYYGVKIKIYHNMTIFFIKEKRRTNAKL